MIVRAIHVGAPAEYQYQGKTVTTAFFKYPVHQPLFLGTTGFAEDAQVDRQHHGGPDKAALLYPWEHYAHWQQNLGKDPGPAAMGENLTVEGLTEEQACIGDVYTIGGAVVQVSQPRVPCYKTAIRHGVDDMAARVTERGFTGFYVRVLTEGTVAVGDALKLVSRPEGAPTVAQANRIFYDDSASLADVQALVDAEGLAEVWRTHLGKRLGR